VIDNLHIDQQQFFIPEGGLALLFSDGLHEVFNSQGDIFGLDRIKSELLVHRHEREQTICKKTLACCSKP